MDDFKEFPFRYLIELGLSHFIVDYQVTIKQGEDKFLYFHGNELDFFDLKLLNGALCQLYNDENDELLDLKSSLLDILSKKIYLKCTIKKEI